MDEQFGRVIFSKGTMMTKLLSIVILFSSVLSLAQDPQPIPQPIQPPDVIQSEGYKPPQNDEESIFVFQKNGRLQIITSSGQNKDWHIEKCYNWEGGASRIFIQFGKSENTELTITWHIDIAGPDWLDVTVVQDKDFIKVTSSRYAGNPQLPENVKWKVERTFKDCNELLADRQDDTKFYVMGLLERMHQNPRILDFEFIKNYNFGSDEPCDAGTEGEELKLIEQLNDDDWHARVDAQKKLLQSKFMSQLYRLINNKQLTPEQNLRIGMLVDCSKIEIPIGLWPKIVEVFGIPQNRVPTTQPGSLDDKKRTFVEK